MSVVACKLTENGYEIAADSSIVIYDTQVKSVGFAKLFSVNDMNISGVGLAEETVLVRIFSETHKPRESSEQAILEFLWEFADWKNKRTDTYQIENSYIIGFEHSLFVVDRWNIMSVDQYTAIGSGMDFALAALHLGKTPQEAVMVAIELSVWCEEPIKVIRVNSDA